MEGVESSLEYLDSEFLEDYNFSVQALEAPQESTSTGKKSLNCSWRTPIRLRSISVAHAAFIERVAVQWEKKENGVFHIVDFAIEILQPQTN